MLWNSNVLFGLLLCHVSHISGPSSWLLQPFFRSISSCWPFHNGQLVLFLLPLACCISSPLFSDWLAPSGCFLYGLEPPIFAISLRVRHSRPKPKSTLHLGHKIASIHWTGLKWHCCSWNDTLCSIQPCDCEVVMLGLKLFMSVHGGESKKFVKQNNVKIVSIHWTVHCDHLSQDSMQAICHRILLTQLD